MHRLRTLLEAVEGIADVEIVGAFPETVLNACAARGIRLQNPERADVVSFRASVSERALPELERAAADCRCEMKLLNLRGGSLLRRWLRKRIWLPLSAGMMLILLLFSSLFIWEIDVVGCQRLSRGEVLRALSDCGVEEGCFWPSLSGDLVRSEMLTQMPEIAWMTVNVCGSRATVLISERREKPELVQEGEWGDLVAARDGIVRRMSALTGRAMVSPGQAVRQGETLITGELESLSGPTRFVRAAGSVTAETSWELTAVQPLEAAQKTGRARFFTRYALKIGKNRYNFYAGSGKMLDGYDKIVHEYNLGIKGLFATPVSLVREELICTKTEPGPAAEEERMKRQLLELLTRRIDGEVLSESFRVEREDGLLKVSMTARCLENIAVRPA